MTIVEGEAGFALLTRDVVASFRLVRTIDSRLELSE